MDMGDIDAKTLYRQFKMECHFTVDSVSCGTGMEYMG